MENFELIRGDVFNKNYAGPAQPLGLKPQFNVFYNEYVHLREYLLLMDMWQYKMAFEEITQAIHTKKIGVDGYKMIALINLIYGYYDKTQVTLDNIMRLEPTNQLAQFLSVVIDQMLLDGDKFYELQNTLDKINPVFTSKLVQILKSIEDPIIFKEFCTMEHLTDDLDVFIIFGYGLNSDGTISEPMQNRLELALSSAQKIPHAKVIVSGGGVTSAYNEALFMRNWLVEKGITAERIILEPFAKDTVGNVVYSGQILMNAGFKTACIVTSPQHLKRAWLTLKTFIKSMNKEEIMIYGALTNDSINGRIPSEEKQRIYGSVLQVSGFFTDWFEKVE